MSDRQTIFWRVIGVTFLIVIPIVIGFGLETGRWLARQTLTDTAASRQRARYESCLAENRASFITKEDAEQLCAWHLK